MLLSEHTNPKPLLMQGLFLCLITAAYCWISIPALQGGFILDDYPNFENLEQVNSITELLKFILNGISSVLGRPISLLSFALQAEHWPHNPYPFKVVGIVIHIINAWLVYLCCHLIAKYKNWPERSCFIFAGTVFGLWLFHPLNISTTFYVVQRMVLLAAFFSLLGITAFLWGFKLSINDQVKKGFLVASLGMVIIYVLGILSKENAVLTGLGIAVLYGLLLRPQQGTSAWDKWMLIFGVLPSLIILSYLCFTLDHYTRAEFTPYQRLLTESVILLDYVDKILLPTPFKLNIFNDGFPVYKDLLGSFIAMKAVSIWLALLFCAVWFRKSAPFFAFAVFWFLSGHLIESSIFGLELYFEHRNYLPSLGIVIGIVGTAIQLNNKADGYSDKLKKISNYACITVISALGFWYVLVYGAEIQSWSHPGKLAISALTERPNSPRAHQEAASFFANEGDFKTSAHILDTIEKRWPTTGNYAQYLMLKCFDEKTAIPTKAAITDRFKNGGFDRGTLEAMKETFSAKKKDGCTYLSWQEYLDYVEILFNNPAFASQNDDFLILQAYSYTALKQPEQAAQALDRIPNEQATVDYLLYKAQFFAVAGNSEKSLTTLEFIKAKYGNGMKYKLTNEKMVHSMEAMIKQSQKDKLAKP
jgi:hypothetical protein